jgi:hypothetical protein
MRSGVGRVGFVPLATNGAVTALNVLGDEWNGMALDFLSNTYVTRVSLGAETLFGPGPIASASETGVALDFLDNTSALKV